MRLDNAPDCGNVRTCAPRPAAGSESRPYQLRSYTWRMSRRAVTRATLALVLLAATVAARPAAQSSAWLGPIRSLASPAAASSGQPHLHATADGVLLSWVERKGARATLKVSRLRQGGWDAPRTVASGDDWFVNWADVPSVVQLEDGTLAAHWLRRSGPSKYAYDVMLSRSTDDGRTWSAPVRPHHDGTQTEHGFASLFQAPDAGLALVWLDGRQTTSGGGHDGHGSGGAMTLRYAAFDRQGRQQQDEAVDLRVCDCCPTAAAVTSDGPIVAYRDRSEDEVRDIHVTRLEQGRWTAPIAVHADGWKIAACPVNGPAIVARDRHVALAWFTAVGDVGHASVAFSTDAGRSFGPPVRLDDAASMGRVGLALLDDGSVVATWIDLGDTGASFMARRITPGGDRSSAVRVAGLEGSRTAGYPRVAVHGRDLVLAWTDASVEPAVVRTAVAALRP